MNERQVKLLQTLEKERKNKIQPIKYFAPLHFGTFPRSCVYIANKNWANLCSDFRPYLSFAWTPFLYIHSSVVNFTHFSNKLSYSRKVTKIKLMGPMTFAICLLNNQPLILILIFTHLIFLLWDHSTFKWSEKCWHPF